MQKSSLNSYAKMDYVKNNYHNGLFKVEGKNSIMFAILLLRADSPIIHNNILPFV
jgi:hypothetical protein